LFLVTATGKEEEITVTCFQLPVTGKEKTLKHQLKPAMAALVFAWPTLFPVGNTLQAQGPPLGPDLTAQAGLA
jgi:hypothetical protein